MLAAIGPQTRLMFLTSPNNPTGLVIPQADIVRIARRAPQVLVLVDEAYADFSQHHTRRRSRERGVAERLHRPHVCQSLRACRPARGRRHRRSRERSFRSGASFRRSASTPAPPRRSLPDSGTRITSSGIWPRCERRKPCCMRRSRTSGIALLAKRRQLRAGRNSAIARPRSSMAWRRGGVHVRDKSRDPACAGCIRVTTGVVEHTQACIRALEEVLCGAA